jgi:antitoxin component YwqK of YwqJK toxin-antitoxin module
VYKGNYINGERHGLSEDYYPNNKLYLKQYYL